MIHISITKICTMSFKKDMYFINLENRPRESFPFPDWNSDGLAISYHNIKYRWPRTRMGMRLSMDSTSPCTRKCTHLVYESSFPSAVQHMEFTFYPHHNIISIRLNHYSTWCKFRRRRSVILSNLLYPVEKPPLPFPMREGYREFFVQIREYPAACHYCSRQWVPVQVKSDFNDPGYIRESVSVQELPDSFSVYCLTQEEILFVPRHWNLLRTYRWLSQIPLP